MKIFNSLIAYLLYWVSPKTLVNRSFKGVLLQLGVRLPDQVTTEIATNIFEVYRKNALYLKLTKKKNSMANNLQTMFDLIQYEAFYIRDLLNPSFTHVIHDDHQKTIEIFKKHKIEMPNLR